MNALADTLGRLLGAILVVNLQNRAMLRQILKKLNDGNAVSSKEINHKVNIEYRVIADAMDKENLWLEKIAVKN
jgi:hypothetical protein